MRYGTMFRNAGRFVLPLAVCLGAAAGAGWLLWVSPGLAADGVDEVLTGFLVKRRPETDLPGPRSVLFTATDAHRAWWVNLTHDGALTTRVDGEAPEADVTVSGTARELYLTVWNRGRAATASDPGLWDEWAERVKVTWS